MSDFMHILYILFLTYFRGILTFILLFCLFTNYCTQTLFVSAGQ